ncbi:hypothetical protein [Roseibium algae]|uniref:Head-tail joining protein n=1 Tax=Roseibium algae TaxID=3123038 RepID=A0ABU8TJX3_9HYPH
MSALFDGLRNSLTTAVDGVLAEQVQLNFVKDGRSDPARPVVTIEAVLRTRDQSVGSLSGGTSKGWSSDIATGGAVLKIDRTKYPDLDLRKGDRVKALDRAGCPVFSIQTVDARNHVRLIVELGDT